MIGPQTGYESEEWKAACEMLSSRFPQDAEGRRLLVVAVNHWGFRNGTSNRSGQELFEKFSEIEHDALETYVRCVVR